jgi:hypothetical protein
LTLCLVPINVFPVRDFFDPTPEEQRHRSRRWPYSAQG